MHYLLAGFAIIVPVVLVVQSIRGRVRMQCCAPAASLDARLRAVTDITEDATAR